MLACDQTITLVKHIAAADGDSYSCRIVDHASWYSRVSIVTSGDGAKPVNTYEVRIMSALEGAAPELGDYCVHGEVSGVKKPADLKEREYFRITAIGKNLRGNLPHWRLSGQ